MLSVGKLGFYFWTFYIFFVILSFFFTKNSLKYELVNFLDEQKEFLLFFLHKNKFIHSFSSSFSVCLLATCSLLCAMYDCTYLLTYLLTMYLLVCIFLQTCVGIMEIATGPEQCNASLTKGQEISEAIFFCLQFFQKTERNLRISALLPILEPQAGILKNI